MKKNAFFKSSLSCFLLLLVTFSINAQNSPIKYGKVDMADLQMKAYAKDTAAEAIVLCDFGTHNYTYRDGQGLKVAYERHRRIKILKKSGYEWATYSFGLSNSRTGTAKEYASNIKGATYNLVDGKIVTTKLEKSSIFLEKKSENLMIQKITLPNVQEGSVIEYSYRIESDFDTEVRSWEFQRSIPTLWSEYQVKVPEFYQFQLITQGYEPFVVSSITKEALNLGAGFENIAATYYRFVQKDVPALKVEPYITTIEDYRSQVEFEISAYVPTGGIPKHFSSTWNDFSKSLTNYDNFGRLLNKGGFLKEVAATIKATAKDSLSKIQAAYNYVAKNMTWNQQRSFLARGNLKKAFEAKTGNSADLNLMLIALLRELDIEADPVVLSTRDNGRVLDYYVLERKFNYVIAAVDVQGQWLLIDATEPSMPLGTLPIRCLNGKGRWIHGESGDWVELKTNEKLAKTLIANFEIAPEGQIKGQLSINHISYAAHDERMQIKKDTKAKYIDNLKKSHNNWEVRKVEFEDENEIERPLQVKLDLNINEGVGVAGDRIYFNPMIGEGESKNPFTTLERKYPVDFGTLIEESFIATYTIPKGYVVEEIPKSMRVNLPEDAGRFAFMVAKSEDLITISSKIMLKKTMYFAEEYELLKRFYDQIIQKHAEQIVLKKAQ